VLENTRPLLVREIMSSPVITAQEDDSIGDVASTMHKRKIGAVIVVDKNGKPVGMITQGDIVRRLVAKKEEHLLSAKAKQVMSRPIIFIEQDKSLDEAARTMVAKRVKKLCVVDNSKKLVGIVTDNDIMKNSSYLIEVLSEMINTGYSKED